MPASGDQTGYPEWTLLQLDQHLHRFIVRGGQLRAFSAASSLADQQNKCSGNDQQGNQNTDDERRNRMPIVGRLRPSAFLRCSDA